jgi:hypothetical protein
MLAATDCPVFMFNGEPIHPNEISGYEQHGGMVMEIHLKDGAKLTSRNGRDFELDAMSKPLTADSLLTLGWVCSDQFFFTWYTPKQGYKIVIHETHSAHSEFNSRLLAKINGHLFPKHLKTHGDLADLIYLLDR